MVFTHAIQLIVLKHNTGVSAVTSYAFILKSLCSLQKRTKNDKSLGKKYCGKLWKTYNQSTNKNISISTK